MEKRLLLPACFYFLLVSAYTLLLLLILLLTLVDTSFCFSTWTEDQWLPKSPEGLQHQIGTAEASCLADW